MSFIYTIDYETLCAYQANIIYNTGGTLGVRNPNALKSALENIFSTFNGIELYPTIEEKAAQLCYSLICNHGFVDGNKRIGVAMLYMFLSMNGIKMRKPQKKYFGKFRFKCSKKRT